MQSPEAIELQRLQQEFLRGVKHEIRTPLSSVLEVLDLLLATPLNGQQREYAGLVRRAIGDVFTRLRPSLDLAALSAATAQAEPEVFDLIATIESAVAGGRVVCNLDRALPTLVNGSADRVKEVVTQLVRLALRGIGPEAEVELHARAGPPTGTQFVLFVRVRESGVGAGFTFAVPLGLVDQPPHVWHPALAGRSALVVTGRPSARAMQNLLGQFRMQSLCCEGIAQAAAALENNPRFDVAFLDESIPGGLEANSRELKSFREGLPVVWLASGALYPRERRLCAAVVKKPVCRQPLYDTLLSLARVPA